MTEELFQIEDDSDFSKNEKLRQEEYEFDVAAEEVAKSRNMCVVLPQSNQLQIDLDTEEDYQEFLRRFDEFRADGNETFNRGIKTEIYCSASGFPHRHVYITFKDRTFTELERILIQAALNDDPLRVYLNTKRFLYGVKNPSRLFEKPQREYYTKNGLLYLNGQDSSLETLESDLVANRFGFGCAEKLIQWLEENQDKP